MNKIILNSDIMKAVIDQHVDFVLRFPSGTGFPSCIPIIVILQLLTYNVANLKDCSIDKSRNLAKSVTVE